MANQAIVFNSDFLIEKLNQPIALDSFFVGLIFSKYSDVKEAIETFDNTGDFSPGTQGTGLYAYLLEYNSFGDGGEGSLFVRNLGEAETTSPEYSRTISNNSFDIEALDTAESDSHDYQFWDGEAPALILFGRGELLTLCYPTERVIFSGAQINVGTGIRQYENSAGPETEFSTLKAESERTIENDDPLIFDMVIGQPCPPYWGNSNFWMIFLPDLTQYNPDDNPNDYLRRKEYLRRAWVRFTYKVLGNRKGHEHFRKSKSISTYFKKDIWVKHIKSQK